MTWLPFAGYPSSPKRCWPLPLLRWLLRLTVGAALLSYLAIYALDGPLARWVPQQLASWQPAFFRLATRLDSLQGLVLSNYGLLGWLAWLGVFAAGRLVLQRPAASLLLVTLLTRFSTEGAANLLKALVHRPRPAQGTPDSFPSSHTAIYFALVLPAAACFPRYRLPLLVLPALVGMGRLVENVHYLSDVLAGVALAGACTACFLGFGLLLDQPWRRRVIARQP